MKNSLAKGYAMIMCILLLISSNGCDKRNKEADTEPEKTVKTTAKATPEPTATPKPTPKLGQANPTPTWYADEPILFKGKAGDFDETAVKDPSIVYYNGKYHMFFTGVTKKGGWQMGYASAKTLPEFKNAKHIFFSNIKEGYFCAPEVFYFEPQNKWYMIYNDGMYGAAYTTTDNIEDPVSWSSPKSLGLPSPTGYDFSIICDDKYAYIFYTENGQSRRIMRRKTSLDKFPSGWSDPEITAYDTFEGVTVVKSKSDGMYYMLPEDYNDNRYYELWSAEDLGGTWTRIAEKWASRRNLQFNADHWTDNVSHGEILRSGINQKKEIEDINKADFLIQGVVNGNYPDYAQIPWELGIIRNYKK